MGLYSAWGSLSSHPLHGGDAECAGAVADGPGSLDLKTMEPGKEAPLF